MGKIVIKEQELINIIKKYINEELIKINEEWGVSDDVIEFTDKLGKEIINAYNNGNYQYVRGDNGYRCANGTIKLLFVNNTIVTVNFYLYEFRSDFDKYSSGVTLTASTKQSTKTIYLTGAVVNGEIDKPNLYDSLQHEVHHIYQNIMSGKLIMDTHNDELEIAFKCLNDEGNNGWNKILATIVYMSFKEEQEAFSNGMYAYLMKKCKNANEIDKVYKETEAYKRLLEIKEINTKFKSIKVVDKEGVQNNLYDSIDFDKAASVYKGLSRKWFPYAAKDLEVKLEKRINKIKEKARKDMFKEHGADYIQ